MYLFKLTIFELGNCRHKVKQQQHHGCHQEKDAEPQGWDWWSLRHNPEVWGCHQGVQQTSWSGKLKHLKKQWWQKDWWGIGYQLFMSKIKVSAAFMLYTVMSYKPPSLLIETREELLPPPMIVQIAGLSKTSTISISEQNQCLK